MRELINEWQSSNDERALWQYLGLSEDVFNTWLQRCKSGCYDA